MACPRSSLEAIDSICVMMHALVELLEEKATRERKMISKKTLSNTTQDIVTNTTLTLTLVESTQDELLNARSSPEIQEALDRFVTGKEEIDRYSHP